MIRHATLTRFLVTAAVLLQAAGVSSAQTYRLSSRFLARGEKALLEIVVPGMHPPQVGTMPVVPGVDIQQRTFGPVTLPTRTGLNEFSIQFLLSSHEVGNHTIPPVDVMIAGRKTQTPPIDFSVFNPDELKLSEAKADDVSFHYAAIFRASNPNPFNGESTPVELKIYVPAEQPVVDWGIPDFERDGVTTWRFQPNLARSMVNLLGTPFTTVAYPSTLTPIKEGQVRLGPAKVRLTLRMVDFSRGVPEQVLREVYLAVPPLDIQSKPLPQGAPEGFENAVGSFTIKSSSEVSEIQEGDPVSVEIDVRGTGNLDTLRPPVPADTGGWKIYETTAEQRGDERREISGNTRFRLFMRPLELKNQIPAFKLVYFDPKLEKYTTVLTDPIPLVMKPATKVAADPSAVPPALAMPVERMTDILGTINPSSLLLPEKKGAPAWLWHTLGAITALLLLGKAWWMRNRHRFTPDPVRRQRLEELREVERFSGDDGAFLMTTGRFIERWLSNHPEPALKAVLSERDQRCFRNDASGKPDLGPKRRREILDQLRKAAILLCAGFFLTNTEAGAEDIAGQAIRAYDAAKYDEAAALWLKAGPYERLSADTLLNIGNACYRAGSPGNAALYYRRALSRDPSHAEARQNLRFIERKYGSITVKRPDYQYVLARISLDVWKGMLWGGLWMVLLSILVFPATRDGARMRIPALIGIICGPLIAGSGALGWRYYPNDAEFSPIAKQAVIIAEKAVLHADASRTSPEVIDAPPGSLCEVIRESGRWAYISFATKTRGWIPAEMIEKVVPEKTPEPPKIRKAMADGKSA